MAMSASLRLETGDDEQEDFYSLSLPPKPDNKKRKTQSCTIHFKPAKEPKEAKTSIETLSYICWINFGRKPLPVCVFYKFFLAHFKSRLDDDSCAKAIRCSLHIKFQECGHQQSRVGDTKPANVYVPKAQDEGLLKCKADLCLTDPHSRRTLEDSLKNPDLLEQLVRGTWGPRTPEGDPLPTSKEEVEMDKKKRIEAEKLEKIKLKKEKQVAHKASTPRFNQPQNLTQPMHVPLHNYGQHTAYTYYTPTTSAHMVHMPSRGAQMVPMSPLNVSSPSPRIQGNYNIPNYHDPVMHNDVYQNPAAPMVPMNSVATSPAYGSSSNYYPNHTTHNPYPDLNYSHQYQTINVPHSYPIYQQRNPKRSKHNGDEAGPIQQSAVGQSSTDYLEI
ncbi:hypothetical protein L596_020442 [Steinernema carpocapsae]|uniref:Uncharacterized protein n=1 Tax=Steinernema carpocapsae TaxID=34508 RepID=A0A4U5MTJ9_STECR|nr:hypothetical protein L596_020442 [Steinernema carpocapsae]